MKYTVISFGKHCTYLACRTVKTVPSHVEVKHSLPPLLAHCTHFPLFFCPLFSLVEALLKENCGREGRGARRGRCRELWISRGRHVPQKPLSSLDFCFLGEIYTASAKKELIYICLYSTAKPLAYCTIAIFMQDDLFHLDRNESTKRNEPYSELAGGNMGNMMLPKQAVQCESSLMEDACWRRPLNGRVMSDVRTSTHTKHSFHSLGEHGFMVRAQ